MGPRLRLTSYLVVFLVLVGVRSEDKGENVALHKKVYGHGRWLQSMVDGNLDSVGEERNSGFPHFFIDLGASYNLTSLHLFVQNKWSYSTEGLNVPFSVATYDKYISVCDLMTHRPWNTLGTNVTFTKKGDEKVYHPTQPVWYIILWRETPDFPKTIAGLFMGEIQAFGTKTDHSELPKEPQDLEVPPNYHKETRKAVIGQQTILRVEQSFGSWIPSIKHKDVAFGWHHNRINSMAVKRGKGRMVVIQGTQFLNLLTSHSSYNNFRTSLTNWLAGGAQSAQFVRVTQPYKPNDILMITRDDKFDVDKVYEQLIAGTNFALFGYLTKDGEDDATLLLKKLEIEYRRHDGQYAPRDISLQPLINSGSYIPLAYTLETAVKSWTLFRTEYLPLSFSWEEWDSDRVQELIREIVKRYEPYISTFAPCWPRGYTANEKTLKAVVNYNMLLRYQLGDKVEKLHGIHYTPGDISDEIKPTTYTVTINSPLWGKFYPVGGYAKAGEGFKWKVIKTTDETFNDQYIRVNAQTDNLASKSPLWRWPSVSQSRPFTAQGRMASPFGGPIYLQIPGHVNITIEFQHVYRYAWLDLMNPKSIETFDAELEKYQGVPWLVVVGDKMITQLSTLEARGAKAYQIERSANYNDNCIKLMHNYRGSKFEEFRDEVFAMDAQISVGAAHAGYPFMAEASWASVFVNWHSRVKLAKVVGIPHELGHNLHTGAATLKNGGEVTNNVLIPVCFGHLLNKTVFVDGSAKCFEPGDKNGAVRIWKSTEYHGPPQIYYCYLSRYFSDGLVGNAFTEAYKNSRTLNNEAARTQFWLQKTCEISGYNLLPYDEMWNFPITEETRKVCEPFPCFLPDDELIRQAQDKVDKILKKYGGNCIRENPKRTVFKGDLMRGVDIRKPQYIFFHE